MANVQHTYSGTGDPNNNPELNLTGEAVGLHFYLDTDTGNVWFSVFEIDFGEKVHARWREISTVTPPK